MKITAKRKPDMDVLGSFEGTQEELIEKLADIVEHPGYKKNKPIFFFEGETSVDEDREFFTSFTQKLAQRDKFTTRGTVSFYKNTFSENGGNVFSLEKTPCLKNSAQSNQDKEMTYVLLDYSKTGSKDAIKWFCPGTGKERDVSQKWRNNVAKSFNAF
ncbi:MAG: hypothetical protein N4A43_01460 [Alphaproteobacteria bacterium]|jgi:hypothetical protein|nr:hypothetical protein [Alphaproteobacteria bacterium]